MAKEYKHDANSLMAEWLANEVHIKGPAVNGGVELEKLLKEVEKMTRPHFSPKKKKKKADILGGGGGRRISSFVTSHKQLVIIKCNYVADSLPKHKAYLKDYLPQENKEEVIDKPKLFNDIEDVVSEETILEYENKFMDKLFFRMIISPQSQKVPLKILGRQFAQKVNERTGYNLHWFAAEHHDTGKQHLHFLINGKDKFGKDVRFEKVFFRAEFRMILQDICTDLIGPRKDYEIKRDMEEGYRAKRWTKIDNDIKKRTRERITADKEFPFADFASKSEKLHTRLKFFKEIGIAKQNPDDDSPEAFILDKHWEERLRDHMHYHCYEQFMLDFKPRENCDVHYCYKDLRKTFEGTIVEAFHQDFEYESDNAVVVKADNGEYWYIPFNGEELPKGLEVGGRFVSIPKKSNRSPVSPQKSTNLQAPVSPQPSVAPNKSVTPQTPAKSQSSSKTKSKTKPDPEPDWSR